MFLPLCPLPFCSGKKIRLPAAGLLLLALMGSCAPAITQQGTASYYADKFDGRKTANGETFRNSALTAAHKTIPFGTKVKVTNARNGKTVKVRINDRGPNTPGRIIDLSKSAARKIDLIDQGVGEVKIKYKAKK